jgi:hypothetical protein
MAWTILVLIYMLYLIPCPTAAAELMLMRIAVLQLW